MATTINRRIAVFLAMAALVLSIPAVALAGVPGAPTGLSATAGDTQVALTWVAPVDNGGGGGITTYNVEYSVNAGASWALVVRAVDTAVSYTATSLVNGTSYLFRVSAVNGADASSPSTSVSATPFVVHTAGDLAAYSACPINVIPLAGFTDTSSTDVDCIKYYGITKGTTATTYSPLADVTRWQMALFLTRMANRASITLPDGSAQGFTDIASESDEIKTAINQIKQLGITVGKTATTYAPADNVTREEMALFISRLLELASSGPGGNTELGSGSSLYRVIKSIDPDYNFTDITQGTYEVRDAIVNLWNLGVTDVQTGTLYEPTVDMTRQAMATFMAGALAHTNTRPEGLILQPSSYRLQNGFSVSMSVTHRTDGFLPIVGSVVDTFRFNHSIVSTVTRFDSIGNCTSSISASQVGNTKCTVDTSDPVTDSDGNLVVFTEVPPTANKVDLWAWTASTVTVYDNDLNAAEASKVTVETYP